MCRMITRFRDQKSHDHVELLTRKFVIIETRGCQMMAYRPNPAHHLFLLKFCWNTTMVTYLGFVCVSLQWQSWIVEIIWHTKTKIFTLWPFVEKVCWPLEHRKEKQSKGNVFTHLRLTWSVFKHAASWATSQTTESRGDISEIWIIYKS